MKVLIGLNACARHKCDQDACTEPSRTIQCLGRLWGIQKVQGVGDNGIS